MTSSGFVLFLSLRFFVGTGRNPISSMSDDIDDESLLLISDIESLSNQLLLELSTWILLLMFARGVCGRTFDGILWYGCFLSSSESDSESDRVVVIFHADTGVFPSVLALSLYLSSV